MSIKVGTICVGTGHIAAPYFNGMECEVVGPLAVRTVQSRVTGESRDQLCYIVQWANGERLASVPERLKPKRPPASDDDMAWALSKVRGLYNNQPATIS
jgi:hypothetical protein